MPTVWNGAGELGKASHSSRITIPLPPTRSWREGSVRIVADVPGQLNWIQGPVTPDACVEELFIFHKFLRSPN